MIFYFSATGNSRMAAKIISKNNDEKLISITDSLRSGNYEFRVTDKEKIGFVFPVYYYGIPTAVIDFISNLHITGYKNNYTFVLLTCGSTTGNTAQSFSKLLLEKGLSPNASYAVSIPDNYIPLLKIASEDEINKKLTTAKEELQCISGMILKEMNGDFIKIKGFAPSVVSFLAYPFYKYRRRTKKFFAKENCTSCGKCANECPVKAIEINDGKPLWVKKQCVFCLGCIHGCPVRAIEYGKATANKGRYTNKFKSEQ